MFEDVEEIRPAEGESELHFYYNREERIARAPQNVQDYYNGGMRPVRGFRIFFTKQNRFIFFGLILFVAFAWIYSGINSTRDQCLIDGVVYNLTAFSYDDEVYVTIKSKFKSEADQRQVPYTANIFAINSDNQIQEKIILQGLTSSNEEASLRTKISDFDIKRVDVILDTQKESKELSAFVKR
ncbi:MAG: hypothetical protein K5681_07595 [Treponema sp.]|nr:hypothetical protein [Treponema sp.]